MLAIRNFVAVVVLVLAVAPALAAHGLAGLGEALEGAALGHVALGRRVVARARAPVVDEAVGLQLADHRVEARVGELGDVHVPEHLVDRAVAREQLAHLRPHVFEVPRLVGLVARPGAEHLVVAAQVRVVGVMPVRQRVVEPEENAAPAAGLGQHGEHVPPVRRVRHLVVGLRGVPHAEAVVVLGGEAEVLHAGRLQRVEPALGVVAARVELGDELLVVAPLHAPAPQDLLVPRRDRVQPPVHEQAEALLEEPVAAVAELP